MENEEKIEMKLIFDDLVKISQKLEMTLNKFDVSMPIKYIALHYYANYLGNIMLNDNERQMCDEFLSECAKGHKVIRKYFSNLLSIFYELEELKGENDD